jgi:hypothetical protein
MDRKASPPRRGAFVEDGKIQRMDLPKHWQPSSDERILAWLRGSRARRYGATPA